MLPIPSYYALYLAMFTGGFLLLLGAMFLFAPARGLTMTKHRLEELPTIMAGRYFFMVLVTIGVAITGTIEQVGYVFLGLAGIAFFDAAVYARARTAVAPHLAAGFGALVASTVAFGGAS